MNPVPTNPKLCRLQELRIGLATQKAVIDKIISAAQSDPDYVNAAAEIIRLNDEAIELEASIRDEAVKAYEKDKTKLPGTTISGKTTTTVIYDPAVAMNWAKEDHPEFMKFDSDGFQDYAIAVQKTPAKLDFVKITTSVEHKASIARDLTPFLPKETDDTQSDPTA